MSIKLTWFGAACILMSSDDHDILFDPFFENISIHKGNAEIFSRIDRIFITHGHFDHIAFSQELLEQNDAGIMVPEGVAMNVERWCKMKNKEQVYRPYNFSTGDIDYPIEKLRSRIENISIYKRIDISDRISVLPFRSNHVRYDPAIFRDKLSKPSSYKFLPSTIKIGLHYRKKQVVGYLASFHNLKVVTFGSMPHQINLEMPKLGPVDVLFVPMAGKKAHNLVAPALRLIEAFQPRIVIPNHQNDFFPPLSDDTDVGLLREALEKRNPEIRFVEPVLGECFWVC
jgi:L-ascorbate metabolism protein UlaG (beta-lactamase superfamily)